MTKYKQVNDFSNTFKNALRGIMLVMRSEKNIKVHFVVGSLVIFTASFMKFSSTSLALLLLTVAMVIVTEMINTAIEYTLDAVYKNNYSKIVEMAKDISAGAVFMSTIISICIGILLFSYNIFY